MSWTEIVAVIVALFLTAVGFFLLMRQSRKNLTHCPACGKTIFKGMIKCMHCGALLDGRDPQGLRHGADAPAGGAPPPPPAAPGDGEKRPGAGPEGRA